MTNKEKYDHNIKVVNDALKQMINTGVISPLDITKDDVASAALGVWLSAENVVRTQIMGEKPIVLYSLSDEDDDDEE